MTGRVDLSRPIIPDLIPASPSGGKVAGQKASDFRHVLQDAVTQKSGLHFSKHAVERLKHRNMELTPERLARVEQGIEKAARKGCRESLVLLDEMALIVSVPNQTVVTAMDGQSLKNNLFTNIDSAIIV